jgi:hypothetical protein
LRTDCATCARRWQSCVVPTPRGGRLAPTLEPRPTVMHLFTDFPGWFRPRMFRAPRPQESPGYAESERCCRLALGPRPCHSIRCKSRSTASAPAHRCGSGQPDPAFVPQYQAGLTSPAKAAPAVPAKTAAQNAAARNLLCIVFLPIRSNSRQHHRALPSTRQGCAALIFLNERLLAAPTQGAVQGPSSPTRRARRVRS